MNNNNEKPEKEVPQKITIRALYQISNARGKKLLDMFPQYSKTQGYVHAKKPINGKAGFDKRKLNKGRPKKLSVQDTRSIKRTFLKRRRTKRTFISKRVQLQAGVTHEPHRYQKFEFIRL